ncbi:AAA family ATPase [Emticicia oligotrophica]|uniref:AAA family ATPase n=1 Tax=Emticicia oligotrophica TaxID=312279 RepID=UPI00273BF6E2|nr:AAA family ATPase [Emticicia oligotrophica]
MQEVEKLYFFDTKKKKVMPYALLSLEVENFRGIKHLKIDGIPADTKWIFLTGENGFGKTSILQKIAHSLLNNGAGYLSVLEREAIFKTIIIQDNILYIKDKSKKWWGNSRPYDPLYEIREFHFNFNKDEVVFNRTPYFIKTLPPFYTSCYGSSRLDITAAANDDALNQQNPLDNLFGKPNSYLLNINHTLKEAFAYNKDRFEQILEFFKAILPNLADIKIEVNNGEPEVVYLEQDETGHGYNPISFSQLAAGYRNILAMFGDMIIRLQKLQPEVKSISDLKGIVIIDEIELHLHPKYQKWLPSKLSELFPNIQFIVSTHSPIPLLGAPKESVFLKVNRNEEQGITVERIDIDIAGLNPNMVLTSPVFGFDDIFSSSKDKNTVIRKEDVYNDALFYKKLDERLDEHVGSEREQELVKLMRPTAQK